MARERTIHIVSGTCNAGLLARARRVRRREVVTVVDDLAVGPLTPLTVPEDWWALRRRYWTSLLPQEPDSYWHPVLNETALHKASRLVLWVDDDLSEQLLLAWLPSYLAARDLDVSSLRLAGIPRPRRLTPRLRRLQGGPASLRWPRDIELAWLADAWRALTATEPHELLEFLERQNPLLPRLTRSLQHLVNRYPSERTGLAIPDEILLANVRDKGPSVARIIAYSLGQLWDLGDDIGDGVLFSRLLAHGAAGSPAVHLTGGCKEMRDTQATLTSEGARFLSGHENFVERNGINDWVAGVHLDSTAKRVWFRTEEGSLRT